MGDSLEWGSCSHFWGRQLGQVSCVFAITFARFEFQLIKQSMVLSAQDCQQIQEIGRAFFARAFSICYRGFTLSPPKIARKKNIDSEDLIVPMLKRQYAF